MVGRKGITKLSVITKTEKTTEKNGNQKNGQQKVGQPENSATKNDSVGKRETQSYNYGVQKRRQQLFRHQKKMAIGKWAFINVMVSHG